MGVFVIAEIGINHNGDLSLAKKLIESAVEAGCDAVKFQKGQWTWFIRQNIWHHIEKVHGEILRGHKKKG